MFTFWPQMILRAPALKWFGFFFPLFLYSCDLVNCRWGANSEIIGLSSLLRNLTLWNCRMSSLITGSQVLRSATFVSFVCWDKEEGFACTFLMVRGEGEAERHENDPKMSHSFLKQESKCSLLTWILTSDMFCPLDHRDKGVSDSGSRLGCFIPAFGNQVLKYHISKKPF